MLKKPLNSRVVFFSFLCVAILMYACRKDLASAEALSDIDDPGYKMDIPLAKKIYRQVKKEKGALVKTPVADVTAASRASIPENLNNKRYALFEKAYQGETDRSTFVEIPIVYNQRYSLVMNDPKLASKTTEEEKRIIFKNSFDRFIVYKSKQTGKIQHRMVTYIPAIDYLKRHNNKIKHNQINRLDADFTGFIEFKEWDGKGIYLLQYLNGKKVRYISLKQKSTPGKSVSSTRSKTGNVTPMQMNCRWETIEVWGESCIDAGPEGESGSGPECTPFLISSETTYICDGPEDPCRDYGICDPCVDYGICDPEPIDPCIDYGICEEDPNEPEETGEDPCNRKAKVNSDAANAKMVQQNTQIKNNTVTGGNEYGANNRLGSLTVNDFISTPVTTIGQANAWLPQFTWNANDGYTLGFSHGHPDGAAPSPEDVFYLLKNLSSPEMQNASQYDREFYKQNASFTTITPAGDVYVVTVADWSLLQSRYDKYMEDPVEFTKSYNGLADWYSDYREQDESKATQYAFKGKLGNAVNFFKKNTSTGNFDIVSLNIVSNELTTINCPN